MYERDKIGVDVRIDGLRGELSYDIEQARRAVETLKKAYDDAHEIAMKAMTASADACFEYHQAEWELEKLEGIDSQLRKAKGDVDQAYTTWLEWRKS